MFTTFGQFNLRQKKHLVPIWNLLKRNNICETTLITRQVSSMIHSARPTPTVLPVVNIVFEWNLLSFARFWKVETGGQTDGQHVRKQWSLPAVTVGQLSGSTTLQEKKMFPFLKPFILREDLSTITKPQSILSWVSGVIKSLEISYDMWHVVHSWKNVIH